MSERKHKIRLELIRGNTVIKTVEPIMGDSLNNLEFSTGSSLNLFPTLSIKSSDDEVNQVFMGFSKHDIVRFLVSNTTDNSFTTMFEGEFNKSTTKIENKPSKIELDIQAVHSFFRLSTVELSSTIEFKETTFKDFVRQLLEMAEISSKVSIEKNLSKIPITGLSRNTNAFRLFKEVCLMINASVIFNTDNTVNIELRSDRLNYLKSCDAKTITEKDIISMVKTDSI